MTMTDDTGYTLWVRGVKQPPTVPDSSDSVRFWTEQRRILLEQIDNIERLLCISPRTCEIRAQCRQERRVDRL